MSMQRWSFEEVQVTRREMMSQVGTLISRVFVFPIQLTVE
jgi:hypothetical protein